MNIDETVAEVLRLEDTPIPSGAWDLIEEHAYYRTAAPALAREVQRLQEEVHQAQTGHECALVAAYESGLRAGQKAMRERAAALCRERQERHRRGRIRCGPGKKFGKLQVAEDEAFSCVSAIRTLKVE